MCQQTQGRTVLKRGTQFSKISNASCLLLHPLKDAGSSSPFQQARDNSVCPSVCSKGDPLREGMQGTMPLPVCALLGQDEGQFCPGIALHGGIGHVLTDEAGDLPQVAVGLLHHHHVISCPWAEPQEKGEECKSQTSLAPG